MSTITISVNDWTLIIDLLSIVAGFVSNAVQTGTFFGLRKVPSKLLPYLTLLGTFLAAFLPSVAAANPVTGTAILQAVVAGFMAVTGTTVGVTIHQHIATGQPANDNGVVPAEHEKKEAA